MTSTVTLVHDLHGDPADPTILLVHGLGAMGAWWPPDLVAGLADTHHVVVPDLRDSGRSPSMDALGTAEEVFAAWAAGRVPTPPYSLRDVAADVVALLDDLRLDEVHVVGASMGGMVAQHLAIEWPARVASLTSIMSTTGAPDLPAGRPEVLATLRDSVPLDDEESFVAASLEVARRSSFSPLFDADEAERRYRAYWAVGPRGGEGSDRQLAAVLADGDRTQRLASVVAPTLVLHGTHDPLIPVDAGRATAAAVPGASLVELPEVGHELPGVVQGRVVDLVADHVSRAEMDARS